MKKVISLNLKKKLLCYCICFNSVNLYLLSKRSFSKKRKKIGFVMQKEQKEKKKIRIVTRWPRRHVKCYRKKVSIKRNVNWGVFIYKIGNMSKVIKLKQLKK